MEQERIWTLIARKLSEEASAEDLAELDQMVKDIPEIGLYLETLEHDDTEKVEQAYQEMTDALDKQNLMYFIQMNEQEAESQQPLNTIPQNTVASESAFAKLLRGFRRKLHF